MLGRLPLLRVLRFGKDGVIESYDLNCKKMVPAERLRRAGVEYKVGALSRVEPSLSCLLILQL